MKNYITALFTAIFAMVTLSGCLEHGFEDLDTYENADITSIQGVYYRYTTSDVNPGSGENKVMQATLSRSNYQKNDEAGTVSVTVSPASNFPADQLANLSSTNLVVVLNISTAAVIEPIEGAPRLGAPGDRSKPNRYRITAADGTKKDWTVTVTLQK